MDTTTTDDYQPPLRLVSHIWRTVVMVIISVGVWLSVVDGQSEAMFLVDLALGLPAFVLVFYRRRWPLPIALLLAAVGGVSSFAAGPSTLAGMSLATRRKWSHVIAVGAVSLASAQVFTVVQPSQDGTPAWVVLLTNVLFIVALMAIGMYIGSRRELLWTLRTRAERAEAEQEYRVSQARGNERSRIAREMHDVLAHRISQISMHAGALAFRDDLDAGEMRRHAAQIQDTAHEALTDLRGVLGVLRDADTGDLVSAPQPTYADLRCLVDDAIASGMNIEFTDRLAEDEAVPDAVGRTLYRVIQEGITNTRKHAPGALLTVELTGSPDAGIAFTLRNPIGFEPSAAPGSGLGLVGLSERVELRGGRIGGASDGRTFTLHGWIPWEA